MENKNSMRYTNKEKAEMLQKQFLSKCTREDSGVIPTLPPRTDTVVENLVLSEKAVHQKLAKLNVNKSLGPADLHPCLLNELADYLSTPAADMFNKSLQTEQLPY